MSLKQYLAESESIDPESFIKLLKSGLKKRGLNVTSPLSSFKPTYLSNEEFFSAFEKGSKITEDTSLLMATYETIDKAIKQLDGSVKYLDLAKRFVSVETEKTNEVVNKTKEELGKQSEYIKVVFFGNFYIEDFPWLASFNEMVKKHSGESPTKVLSKMYDAYEIINKHHEGGRAGLLDAQQELIDNDLEDYADLKLNS